MRHGHYERRGPLNKHVLLAKANKRIPMTRTEVAAFVGVGRTRVAQLEEEAMAKVAMLIALDPNLISGLDLGCTR